MHYVGYHVLVYGGGYWPNGPNLSDASGMPRVLLCVRFIRLWLEQLFHMLSPSLNQSLKDQHSAFLEMLWGQRPHVQLLVTTGSVLSLLPLTYLRIIISSARTGKVRAQCLRLVR